MPGRGDGSGIPGHHNRVERTNIDAELEGVGRNHTANFSVAEAAFDLAALVGKITAAVAANGLRFSGRMRIRLLQVGQEDFRVQARIRKDHCLQIVVQEFLGHARGFIDVAAADAQRAIDDRGIVENKCFFRGRGAVGVQHFDVGFEEPCGQIAGIGDGGGAADKLRIAAVKPSDAPQATKHVAQVAAEDAAVGVQLVDDDVAQVFEQTRPARVVRQDAGVQHVGIGQDDVAFFTDGFAGVGRSVTVVSENAETVFEALIQIVEFRELILCERFGGEEVQSAGI